MKKGGFSLKQEIRDLFHKGILSEAAKRHGVSVEQVRL